MKTTSEIDSGYATSWRWRRWCSRCNLQPLLYTGLFRFHTIGSSFDTLLSLRSETCTGVELACDDDMGESSSWVQIELNEQQAIVLVVDGWGGAEGDFVLSAPKVSSKTVKTGPTTTVMSSLTVTIQIGKSVGVLQVDLGRTIEPGKDDMLTEVNLRRAEGAYCDQDYYPPFLLR